MLPTLDKGASRCYVVPMMKTTLLVVLFARGGILGLGDTLRQRFSKRKAP